MAEEPTEQLIAYTGIGNTFVDAVTDGAAKVMAATAVPFGTEFKITVTMTKSQGVKSDYRAVFTPPGMLTPP